MASGQELGPLVLNGGFFASYPLNLEGARLEMAGPCMCAEGKQAGSHVLGEEGSIFPPSLFLCHHGPSSSGCSCPAHILPLAVCGDMALLGIAQVLSK